MSKYITEAMRCAKGDNLEWCQHAFKHFTDNEMNEQHGHSGYTRKELLEAYVAERKEYNDAVTLLKCAGLWESK